VKKYSDGTDTQLMKGVEEVMKKISEIPRVTPKHGAFPIDK